VTLWERYVASASRDAALLVEALGAGASADADRAAELAHVAFRLALSSLAIGAEDVGRLALAAERVLDRASSLDAGSWAALGQAIGTLGGALGQLVNADRSGARVEGLPLAERRAALEAIAQAAPAPDPAVRVRVAAAATATIAPAAPAEPTASAFTWTPTVDDDMVELFFDEANERVEALAGKLVEIEREPGNIELLRDVFRDMHTVKGSSAMVGLAPVNQLAHAAEDLVGQIRDAGRSVDGPVIDALLAALDGLRDMLRQARARTPLTVDPASIVARLRNPGTARPVAAAAAPQAAPVQIIPAADRQTIRVDFDKLDRLLNLVGELVLGRDDLRTAVHSLGSVTAELAADHGVARRIVHARGRMRATAPVLGRTGSVSSVPTSGTDAPRADDALARGLENIGDELSRFERVLAEVGADLDHGTDRLDAISGELREQVMRLRMVPVGGVFRKHVRTVRDLAATLGKRARLEIVGDDTELDKLLVEAIDEPLMHLVRNAVDHGLEPPEDRAAADKPPEGVIHLEAAHRGNQVEIRVSDDGRGLDPAKLKARAVERGLVTAEDAAAMTDAAARGLIFAAGFSTAAQVSEISGRGVGMDVVRQTIVSRLKGTIDVESTIGQGSVFVLKLPLTLAIIQVLVARAGGETFAIPLDVVLRVLAIPTSEVQLIGDREVAVVRGKHVPLVRLDHVLELEPSPAVEIQLVLTEIDGQTYALACEHLVGKREIVIKSLGAMLAGVPCVAGATLLGERVALILDVPAVVRRALARPARPREAPRPQTEPLAPRTTSGASHILLVDDSDIVRESLRRLLADAGYIVTVAVDGVHGLELAKTKRFDLVSTDVMMPRMDGYELTRALRAMPEYADKPIVMVTSKDERIDRVRGFDAGVDEYITKPHDRQQLLRIVRKLLGHGEGEP
jgi:chemotaxis protein histidine kinase CheA/ActR/RegA family two-component response regulator